MRDLQIMLTQLADVANTVLAAVPDPGAPQPPPGVGDKANTLLSYALWVVFGIGILGIFIVGGKMMIANDRGQGGQHGASLGWVLGGLILVSSATGITAWFVS